jgi:hypothetical protein
MIEIERRLRELGAATRQPGWDRPLDPRARRKIHRHRAMLPAGALCLAGALATSVTLLPEGSDRARRDAFVAAPAASASAKDTTEPRLFLREVSEDGFSAVWPEDNPGDAAEGCTEATTGSFRTDPVAMASAFGREVMGWAGASATVTGATEGSRQVELSRAGTAASGARVNVSVVELVDDCWAVQSVFDAPGDPPTGLVMDSTAGSSPVVRVGFRVPAGASGEVEVGYGDHAERRSWTGPVTMDDPVEIRLGARPDTTGHLFVLFHDDAGAVEKALAYSLPPRHYSREARERAEGP